MFCPIKNTTNKYTVIYAYTRYIVKKMKIYVFLIKYYLLLIFLNQKLFYFLLTFQGGHFLKLINRDNPDFPRIQQRIFTVIEFTIVYFIKIKHWSWNCFRLRHKKTLKTSSQRKCDNGNLKMSSLRDERLLLQSYREVYRSEREGNIFLYRRT